MENDLKSFRERRILHCSDIEQLLDEHIDGELTPEMDSRFVTHLERCEGCRSLVSDCKAIVTIARDLAETEIPEDVSQRLRAILRDEVGHELRQKPKLVLVKP